MPPAVTPRVQPDSGLARFEDRFRVLGEDVTASLREQSDAFESIMQAAVGAMAGRTKLQAEKSSLQSVVDKLTEERAGLRSSLEGTERDCTHLRTAKESLEKERDELAAARRKIEEQFRSASNTNDELRAANSAFEQDLGRATAANQKFETQIAQMTLTNREIASAKGTLEQQLGEQTRSCDELKHRADSSDHANVELLNERTELKERLAETTTKCKQATSRIESVESAHRDLQKARVDLEQEVASQNARVNELNGHLEISGREKDEVRSVNTKLHAQIASLESDCQALREAADAAETEQGKLQATRATLESCLADLSEKAADLGAGRKESDLRRATEKEMNELRSRIAELESAEGQVDHLKTRIQELESALTDASTSSGGIGLSDELIRELNAHAESARQIVEGLRTPKLEGDQLKTIVKSASELALQLDMLNVTAELSQPDAHIELTTEPIDLVGLLQSTLETLAGSVSRKGLGLTNRIDPLVPGKINCDRQRLQQLIVWSTMFMTRHAIQGDIAVSVAVENDPEGNRLLHFQMYNDGLGMSSEALETLVGKTAIGRVSFGGEVERFAQIAEAMGGRLRIEPAGKAGFAIRLEVAMKPVETTGAAGNRRESDRILQELLQCNLGPVVDVSSTGMRLVSAKNLRGKVTVELGDSLPPLKLKAHVVWSNKLDRKQFEIGLRFTSIRPADVEQLMRIARKHGLAAAG